MIKNFIVFIRAFNDVDHLTPLIYRISKSPDHKAFVFCVDPRFDYENNHNIRFLRENCGLDVKYLHGEFLDATIWKKFWSFLLRTSRSKEGHHLPLVLEKVRIRLNGSSARKLIQRLDDSPGWVDVLFNRIDPHALIFDWVSVSAFANRLIVEEANALDIPTFSLPHGMNLYTNFDIAAGATKGLRDTTQFDYIISQGSLSRAHLEFEGTLPERIVDLGSLRFCREWMRFYRASIVTLTFEGPCDSSKLRVVFFLSKIKYNVDKNLLLQTIEMLAKESDVCLIVKPHTRGMRVRFMQELIDRYQLDVRDETSSVLLSEWADVGLVIGSSVGLQILYDEKLLIYPSYLDSNQSYYDEMGACWRVDSVDELQEALGIVRKDKEYKPYSEENVRNLFKNNVYAGDLNRNVIEDYFQFVTAKAK